MMLDDEELTADEDDARLNPLLDIRRASASSSKKKFGFSLAPKLNIKNLFTKGSRSGALSPVDPRFEDFEQKQHRSKSCDFGGTTTGPLSMNGRRQIVDGFVSSCTSADPDSEIQSITNRKVLVSPPGTVPYTVLAEDSLASIAAKHKSTTSELIRINRMMSPLVFPGQTLSVPTDEYVPIGYGSQNASPRASPKPRSGSFDVRYLEERATKIKSPDSDDAKKQKKPKNRLKEQKPADGFLKGIKNLQLIDKDGAVFQADVGYVTGGQDANVNGQLEITSNEVRFEPDMTGNEADQPLLKELVCYRMALGKAMVKAKIIDYNPYRSVTMQGKEGANQVPEGGANQVPEGGVNQLPEAVKQKVEKDGGEQNGDGKSKENTEDLCRKEFSNDEFINFQAIHDTNNEEEGERKSHDQENGETRNKEIEKYGGEDSDIAVPAPAAAAVEMPVKYLLVKLGIPNHAAKERPTISSLIRGSLPINVKTTVEHCFAIPEPLVPRLTEFLQENYPNVFGKSSSKATDERSDAFPEIRKQTSPGAAKRFKRTISVAELYNLPLPEMSHPSSIFTETHIRIIREHMLPKADGRPWDLAYSSNLHGYSINTLYRQTSKKEEPSMLLVKDMNDKVFGAMLPCSIRISDGFYGTGETFLFTFYPFFKKFCWSGKNEYYLKGNTNDFCIGASDGEFGLWIHDDLDRGRTQRCETFDNDPLTQTSEDFNITCIEVWKFPFSLDVEM